MKEADIKESILGELGEPTVKVELDESAWSGRRGIFDAAKRWFQARKGALGYGLQSAAREVVLPAEAESPLDVAFPGGGVGGLGCLATLGFFQDIVPADVMTGGLRVANTLMSHGDYVQIRQKLEMANRLFGGDREWIWDEARRVLVLPGRVPSGLMLVIWKKARDAWSIEDLRDRDEDFIYRRCVIEAKRRLGRIRSKYDSYAAAGGTVQMDGQALLEEAREEEEKLNEEIADSQMPISIVIG